MLGLGVAGAVGLQAAPDGVRGRLGLGPDLFVPDAEEGRVRLERVGSSAMGRTLDLFTAVPAGHGDGAGLPVVVVMHGASARASDFRDFGYGRFVTAAVEDGAPPFVLAGTDDLPSGWLPEGDADPQRMLLEELPGWLSDRGHDGDRRGLLAWSRGSYGGLRLLEQHPDAFRAAALFSPAVIEGDDAFQGLPALRGLPVGVWCGTEDGFAPAVRALVDALPTEPEVATFAPGAHTQSFWNDHTLEALTWLAPHL